MSRNKKSHFLSHRFLSVIIILILSCAFIYAGEKKKSKSNDAVTSASGKQFKTLRQEDVDFILKNRSGFFATVDKKIPRVRAWGLNSYEDGKLIFVTSNQKPVFSDLKKNKYAEWITMDPETKASLRILGKVSFIKDKAKKKKTLDASEFLTRVYGGKNSHVFEMFSMQVIETHWFTFPAKPKKVAP